MIYKANIDIYEIGVSNKNLNKIFLDDNEIILSVGMFLPLNDSKPFSLKMDAHYNSDKMEELTINIPQLESFKTNVAINPNIENKNIINKLKELNILSDTINYEKYDNQIYEIVKLNKDVLKDYYVFGNTILNDFKEEVDKDYGF